MNAIRTRKCAAIGLLLKCFSVRCEICWVSMRETGARTIAQDESTSVVFGMPRVAFQRGGTDKLVPIYKVASEVMSMLLEKNK